MASKLIVEEDAMPALAQWLQRLENRTAPNAFRVKEPIHFYVICETTQLDI